MSEAEQEQQPVLTDTVESEQEQPVFADEVETEQEQPVLMGEAVSPEDGPYSHYRVPFLFLSAWITHFLVPLTL